MKNHNKQRNSIESEHLTRVAQNNAMQDAETKSVQDCTSVPTICLNQKLSMDEDKVTVQNDSTKEDLSQVNTNFRVSIWDTNIENLHFNLTNIRDIHNDINMQDGYGYNFNSLMFSPKTPLLSPISKLSHHIKDLRNNGREGVSKEEAQNILLKFISQVKTEQEYKLINYTNQYMNLMDNTGKIPLDQLNKIIDIFKKEEESSFSNLSNINNFIHKPEPSYRSVISPVRMHREYSPFGNSQFGICNIPYSPLVVMNNSMTPLSSVNRFAVPNIPSRGTFSDYVKTLGLKSSKDIY